VSYAQVPGVVEIICGGRCGRGPCFVGEDMDRKEWRAGAAFRDRGERGEAGAKRSARRRRVEDRRRDGDMTLKHLWRLICKLELFSE